MTASRAAAIAATSAVRIEASRVRSLASVNRGSGVAAVVGVLRSGSPVAAIWATAVVVATMAVVIRLLRAAVLAISQAWCSPFGWQ
jgi:hypothetical protein